MPTGRYPRPSIEQRFWPRVDRRGGPDACWLWTGAHNLGPRPYGLVSVNGRPMLAHRVSYILSFGAIEAGLDICHRCDNPPCVNPSHLFPGTRKENMADGTSKGRLVGKRHVEGVAHPFAKLNPTSVREMRALYAAGGVDTFALAAKYGVRQSTAWAAIRGFTWKSV